MHRGIYHFTRINDAHQLPIRAHFDGIRYKNKKPIPSNNTYIAVEGFLIRVEVDASTGQPVLFHVYVDNINFLGKAILPMSGSNKGELNTLYL
jgi:hypothetical protein